MQTPSRWIDRHLADTCNGCWRQRCHCRQKADAMLVVKAVVGIAVFVFVALLLAGVVGAGESFVEGLR
jgi:hypothetical protein